MKLFANGCSFTFGGGLYNSHELADGGMTPYSQNEENLQRLQVTWPGVLKEHIGAESVVNYALSGGSNARITRTTLDYFYDLLHKGEDLSQYTAVIQWTELARTEFVIDRHWFYFGPGGAATDIGVGETPQPPCKAEFYVDNYYKTYYKVLQSDQQDVSNFVTQTTALGNFFKTHNVRYVFCMHVDCFLYANKIKKIDQTKSLLNREFNWLNGSMQDSVLTHFLSEGDQVSPDDTHPNIHGHQRIAEQLRNYLE